MLKLTITRREVLAGGLAAAGVATLPEPAVASAPGQMETAIRLVVGEAEIRKGRVTLDLPPLVENGNTVPITVSVDSPMTKADHVKAIHVFNEKNPQANVVSAQLGPRAGKAVVSTRIRLAGTQKLTAIAEMSDGSYWSDSQEVIVTLAACLEDLI
ncbi:MAG: sulfur-oxidizing protein SoxY [Hyphomicrobiales bacterium]|jgi:sulfur-oxidizing protein SoxY|nr:sulfur-oxidizing protein SoxY [Hyphomicrobiales bacterium]